MLCVVQSSGEVAFPRAKTSSPTTWYRPTPRKRGPSSFCETGPTAFAGVSGIWGDASLSAHSRESGNAESGIWGDASLSAHSRESGNPENSRLPRGRTVNPGVTVRAAHALRFSHLRACHFARRGRSDRARAVISGDHPGPPAKRPAQRRLSRNADRGGDPRRQRADRRLVVAYT